MRNQPNAFCSNKEKKKKQKIEVFFKLKWCAPNTRHGFFYFNYSDCMDEKNKNIENVCSLKKC